MKKKEDPCEGCGRSIGLERSTLYCPECRKDHILCFGCVFKPPMDEYNPVDGRITRYWLKCPIEFLKLIYGRGK